MSHIEPGTPTLFRFSTPATRLVSHPKRDPGTKVWREGDRTAASAYAVSLDADAHVLPHGPFKGVLCLWFGMRRHGEDDHDKRLLAVWDKLESAGLRVEPERDGQEIVGLRVLDQP